MLYALLRSQYWKDIVGRCSKVFAGYKDNPLAAAIQRLKIRTENKGFGQDIVRLIQAKNDYKHDRGPFGMEAIQSTSDEVGERLRRCMEALVFFIDYPMRQVEEIDADRSGDSVSLKCVRYMGDYPNLPREELVLHERPHGGDPFLDLGDENWVSLYPFIMPTTCSDCNIRETYFIDSWDRRRNTARMKSFERGHTISKPEVSDSLAEWETADQASALP